MKIRVLTQKEFEDENIIDINWFKEDSWYTENAGKILTVSEHNKNYFFVEENFHLWHKEWVEIVDESYFTKV